MHIFPNIHFFLFFLIQCICVCHFHKYKQFYMYLNRVPAFLYTLVGGRTTFQDSELKRHFLLHPHKPQFSQSITKLKLHFPNSETVHSLNFVPTIDSGRNRVPMSQYPFISPLDFSIHFLNRTSTLFLP